MDIWFYIKDAVFFKDSLKIGHSYVATRPRNHESLFVVTKGNLLYEKNGVKTVIPEGGIGYIEKGSCDVSGPYMCDEVSYIATNFFFGEVEEGSGGIFPFKTLCAEGSFRYPYKKLFEKAPLRDSFGGDGLNYVAIGILLEIIGYLYNEHEHLNNTSLKKNRIIEDAVSYMKENFYDADFKVATLSRLCEMSEKNFRRIFSALYGQTPYEFLQKYRIERAKFLLRNTYKSISEISTDCGFSDVYSFSHCFKRLEGIAPSQYKDDN